MSSTTWTNQERSGIEQRYTAATNLSDNDWRTLTHDVRETVRRDAGKRNDSGVIMIQSFIQQLVLKILFTIYFRDRNWFTRLGDRCFTLVQGFRVVLDESYTKTFAEPDSILGYCLPLILPGVSLDFAMPPLNFLLPAFDGLWRPAMMGFIEVCYHNRLDPHIPLHSRNHNAWIEVLREFLVNPSPTPRPTPVRRGTNRESLGSPRPTGGLTAIHIAKEVLRMYVVTNKRTVLPLAVDPPITNPPARSSDRLSELRSQFIYRDTGVWGGDSYFFKPLRWVQGVTPAQLAAFTPFGTRCPARHEFGVTMLAVLLAVLCDRLGRCQLGGDGRELDWVLGPSFRELPNDREECVNWRLFLPETPGELFIFDRRF